MEEQLQGNEPPGKISLNALTGHQNTSTIRLKGVVNGRQVNILLDSGSTHSFMDSGMFKTLSLTPQSVAPLLVTIADGTLVLVKTICKQVPCTI